MPDVGPKRLAIWRRLAAICAQPGGSGPGLVADSAEQFTEEGSQVLHKHIGASMAAKWPPSAWSDQYATLWSGSISRRRTGSVLNTAQRAGTFDGATQSSPGCAVGYKPGLPSRVNQ
jgi:hypothetical protein